MNTVDPIEIVPGISSRILDYPNGSSVILLPNQGDWIKTSSTGRWILEEVAQAPRSIDQVIVDVSERYGLLPSVVAPSVRALLQRLSEAGLLRPTGQEAAKPPDIQPRVRALETLWLDFGASRSPTPSGAGAPEAAAHLTIERAAEAMAQARDLGASHVVVRVGRAATGGLAGLAARANTLGLRVTLEVSSLDDPQAFASDLLPHLAELCFAIETDEAQAHDDRWGAGAYDGVRQVLQAARRDFPSIRRTLLLTAAPGAVPMARFLALGIRLRASRLRLSRCRSLPGGAKEPDSNALAALLRDHDELVRVTLRRYHLEGAVRKDETEIPDVDLGVDPGSALRSLGRRTACPAAVEVLAVAPDGAVYPCSALVGRCEPSGKIGQEPLPAIRSRMLGHAVAQFHVDRDEDCRSCDFRYFCGGGCRAHAGGWNQHDTACAVIRERCVAQLGSVVVPLELPDVEPTANGAPVTRATRCPGC